MRSTLPVYPSVLFIGDIEVEAHIAAPLLNGVNSTDCRSDRFLLTTSKSNPAHPLPNQTCWACNELSMKVTTESDERTALPKNLESWGSARILFPGTRALGRKYVRTRYAIVTVMRAHLYIVMPVYVDRGAG